MQAPSRPNTEKLLLDPAEKPKSGEEVGKEVHALKGLTDNDSKIYVGLKISHMKT